MERINEGLVDIHINKKKYLFQFDKFKNHFSITYLDYSVDFNFYDKDTAKFEKYMIRRRRSRFIKIFISTYAWKNCFCKC